ncbi:transporter [Sulfurimonas aquatica]|uniref:Transporter n=1 Tax=Sulfurimonas aquatica TaxID=2672570 RepID=A0A975GD62_9BACT|nr:transporter [Sulfurimonas aquatica]QSZ42023.1 transporter [Sulfurimonas aquatica]
MNQLIARVSEILHCDTLHIVKFSYNSQTLTMMSLELNAKVKVGTKVKLALKPFNIALAKELSGDLSFSNQLNATIKQCENGVLLCSVMLDFFGSTLEAITTLSASKSMNLQVGDTLKVLIHASDLSISEILDD